MKNIKLFLLLTFCISLTIECVIAQSRSELEQQRRKTEEEMKFTLKLLEETGDKQKQSIGYLNTLNRQIKQRESLIDNMKQEIGLLEGQIGELSQIVRSLESDIKALIEEYKKMIYHAYKHDQTDATTLFVLSAESFNQAMQRIRFTRYYSEHRKQQVDLINSFKRSLAMRIGDLQEQETEKRSLLVSMNKEIESLEKDKNSQANLVSNLKDREQELKEQLKEQERITERLNRAIEEIIKREMEAARREAERTKSDIPTLSPEQLQLSNEFSSNKSKLPWPVRQGFVAQTFGTHNHPTLSGVQTSNNGIDIQTSSGENVMVVFNGTVSRVVNIPGANRAVIVRHGDYFTVYSNLRRVNVSAGDKLKTGDTIGEVAVRSGSGEHILHFELWHNTDKQNPEHWLYRK